MSTSRARLFLEADVFDVIDDGIRQGAPFSPIRELLELGSAGLKVYGETRSGVAPSTTIAYNLADGSLLDADHRGIVFSAINLIAVRNKRTDAVAYVIVGPDPVAGFGILGAGLGWWPTPIGSGGGEAIAPGSLLCKTDLAGAPVIENTADVLSIVTSAVVGSDNEFDIVLAGPGVSFPISLGPAYEPVLISGAPDFDTNGLYDSLTDHGLGSVTIGINNSTAVSSAGASAGWVSPMPEDWVDDGTKYMSFRLTIETDAPDNVDFYVGLGVCELLGDASNASSHPLAAGVMRQSTANSLVILRRTLQIIKAGSNGTVVCESLWFPGGTLASGDDMGIFAAKSAETGLSTSLGEGGATDGDVRVIVVAGCNDAGNNGPHTVRALLEMAVVDMPSG